jgi:hypothetical protein
MEIRRYVPGDPVRSILWRSYAFNRSLNVRLPERTVAPSTRTAAYLVTGPEDEAAAAAARAAIESDAFGEKWTFAADGAEAPTDDHREALQSIARSGSVTRSNGATRRPGVEAFLARLGREGGFHCVVFAPARAGEWLERCLALSRRHPGALSFVLATDGMNDRGEHSQWRRILLRDSRPPEKRDGDLAALVRQIMQTGAPVVIANRADGRIHTRVGRTGRAAMQ